MQNKTLRYWVLGALLAVFVAGCSKTGKRFGMDNMGNESEHQAHTQGMGDRSGFNGHDSRGQRSKADLLAQRKVYFEYDRADISNADLEVLYAHAEELKQSANRRMRIEGHTDEHGSREYNIGLGERRAQAVSDVMLAQGVPASQLALVSYGKEKPDSLERTDEGHRLNRRAVLVYEDL